MYALHIKNSTFLYKIRTRGSVEDGLKTLIFWARTKWMTSNIGVSSLDILCILILVAILI